MYFLNLMLNAFSSITKLSQLAADAGPLPIMPAALPPGPGVPAGAAPVGYPYIAAGGAAVFNPNFGFNNFNLISNPNVNFGGIEIWYHAQLANYFFNYQNNFDQNLSYYREIPMAGMAQGNIVDFVLRKQVGGVLYEGYFEIKVQSDNRGSWPVFLNDIAKIFRYVQLASSGVPNMLPPPLPGVLPQREYFALWYLHTPTVFVIPAVVVGVPASGYKFQNMHVLETPLRNTPTNFTKALRGPYMGVPMAQYYIPPAIPTYPPPAFQAITPYPPIPGGMVPPVGAPRAPGVVHFFQEFVNLHVPPLNQSHTFQEVGLDGAPGAPNIIQPNSPLLCVYNGN